MANNRAPDRFVVLAAIDDSAIADDVVATASRIATTRGGELHLAHVIDPSTEADTALLSDTRQAQTTGWKEGLKKHALAQQPGVAAPIATHVVWGETIPEIKKLAASTGADVLVVATHGRTGVKRVLLGSVAEALVRTAPCSVVVVREKGEPR